MNILDILSPKAVKVPTEATEKHAIIDELVDLLDDGGLITDAAALKAAVWEREQQRSTGIGEGLAIPHGKCNCSTNLVVAIGRPPAPVEFGSVDKKPVQLVILLASPPTKPADHIQALGKISRLMNDPSFRSSTFGAETADELYELFRAAES